MRDTRRRLGLVLAGLIVVAGTAATTAAAVDSSEYVPVYTGCVDDKGSLTKVSLGDAPAEACKDKEMEITLQGDLRPTLDAFTTEMARSLGGLSTELDSLSARVDGLEQSLASEVSARLAGDTSARAALDAARAMLQESIDLLGTGLADEVATRAAEDGALAQQLAGEASLRAARDTELTQSIADEVAARLAGDDTIAQSLASEESTRAAADGWLTQKINAEIQDRIEGDEAVLAADRFYRVQSGHQTVDRWDWTTIKVDCLGRDIPVAGAWTGAGGPLSPGSIDTVVEHSAPYYIGDSGGWLGGTSETNGWRVTFFNHTFDHDDTGVVAYAICFDVAD